MTQKHHQEEISGPNDSIEAAPLAKKCPRPKRTRIQSRKAQENQAQSQPFEVLSLRPAPRTVPTSSEQKPVPNESSSSVGNDASQLKRQRPPNRQNSSQRADISTQYRKEKEE